GAERRTLLQDPSQSKRAHQSGRCTARFVQGTKQLMIPSSSFLLPLAGGVLIGLSATLLLALHGRVAGISGILGSAISTTVAPQERRWRLEFLLGLAGAGALLRLLVPEQFSSSPASSLLVV